MIDDVYQWNDIENWDLSDVDSSAMAFVAGEVDKYIEMCDDDSSLPRPLTLGQWMDMLGNELAFQKQEDPCFWGFDDESVFDAVCGRVDAYLPYYLENYEPAASYVAW